MEPKKYKVLTYAGMFVDENMLGDGIYGTSTPYLRDGAETIGTIADKWEAAFNMLPSLSDRREIYYENLRQCKLETFELKPSN